MSKVLDIVELATMLPGAQKVDDKNLNPTWKAHVLTNSGTKTAFVKIVNSRKIFIECVCAIVGRNLGLPIPSPMIVQVKHEALGDVVPKDEFLLAFGSEDAGHPSFRRRMNKDSDEAMALLKKYSKLLEISVFDEWISNHDRNVGNILFDGKTNFVFIDHELALPAELSPDFVAHDNQFLRVFFAGISEFEKHQVSKKVRDKLVPDYTAVELKTVIERTLSSLYFKDEEALNIIDILEKRITHVSSLTNNRIAIKQQELAI